jgi:hypothetical protein
MSINWNSNILVFSNLNPRHDGNKSCDLLLEEKLISPPRAGQTTKFV